MYRGVYLNGPRQGEPCASGLCKLLPGGFGSWVWGCLVATFGCMVGPSPANSPYVWILAMSLNRQSPLGGEVH